MDILDATQSFAVLGHAGRLALFRLLMRLAPEGARPTEMAQALGMVQNTLSHHLAELERCGLIRRERQGRSLYYKAHIETAQALLAYLGEDCCRGRTALTPNPVPQAPLSVLFLCSGNSARSIIAEALLRDLGRGQFRVYSAGMEGGAGVNPLAIDVLSRHGHATAQLRSKPLSALQGPDAPQIDIVITLCDRAAAQECPPWPRVPISGHWGLPAPAKAPSAELATDLTTELIGRFVQTYATLRRRILMLAALPLARFDRAALQTEIDRLSRDPLAHELF